MVNKLSRRDFILLGGAGIAAGTGLSSASMANTVAASHDMLLYVGTYTSKGSEGIYVFKFDSQTGKLTKLHTVKGVAEPSFLTISKDRKYLYSVNETEEYEGQKSGAVSAFAIDQKNGNLRFLNKQPSLGGAPCHISISDNGKFVLVANYLGGNVSVFPVREDGGIGASIGLQQHTGSGPNSERQNSPHAHSINLSRSNRFAVSCDLGADKVYIYEFDGAKGVLKPNAAQPEYRTKPGAGPRHFAFHPGGKFAFVINELDTTITSLAFDEGKGTLREIQTVNTLPTDFKAANTCADIHMSPDGRFLYGSNRGHDSIVVFEIDTVMGGLKYVEHVSTGGKKPRNFTISPDGKFLLAANQDSDSINVFKIDRKTGMLTRTKKSVSVSMPVCLKLIPAFQ